MLLVLLRRPLLVLVPYESGKLPSSWDESVQFIVKIFYRIKKEWKSLCYEGDDGLVHSFKSLLQTSNISMLITPEEIKEIFQDLLSAKSNADCDELKASPVSNEKRLCQLTNPSHKWKTHNSRLMKILENYEFSGIFKIVF